MPVILSHTTALEILYSNPGLASLPRVRGASKFAPKQEILDAARTCPAIRNTVHVCYHEKRFASWTHPEIKPHILPKAVPHKSLIEHEHFLVAAPELCFIQLCPYLDLPEAILLACFLCGDYRSSEVRNTYGDRPLSTKQQLEKYVLACQGIRGIDIARRSLLYALENSHSPMESRLATMLSLPPRLGGFGFAAPSLNEPIPGTNREGDLCWLRDSIAIEYDSKEHHSAVENQFKDALRRTEIGATGIDVISVTWAHARNLQTLRSVAEVLALKTHARKRRRDSWDLHQKQQASLHRKLFLTARNPVFNELPI